MKSIFGASGNFIACCVRLFPVEKRTTFYGFLLNPEVLVSALVTTGLYLCAASVTTLSTWMATRKFFLPCVG